jgi:hypothetical protein
MLIESIKIHDTKKVIKLVSIDNLRTSNNEIVHKIHSVPALMFLPSKEIIFGKAVFDYLLLPNRGFLFTTTNTRDKETTSSSSMNSPIPLNDTNEKDGEPSAFILGRISSDRFSNINDDNNNSMNLNNNKLYNWTNIEENYNTDISKMFNESLKNNGSSNKKELNLDDYKKQREMDLQNK